MCESLDVWLEFSEVFSTFQSTSKLYPFTIHGDCDLSEYFLKGQQRNYGTEKYTIMGNPNRKFQQCKTSCINKAMQLQNLYQGQIKTILL